MSHNGVDTKARVSSPTSSTSSHGNVVDHHAANGMFFLRSYLEPERRGLRLGVTN